MGGRSVGNDGKPLNDPVPTSPPSFDWDETKRLSNIEKHGLDFEDAKPIWDGRRRISIASPRDTEMRQVNVAELSGKIYSVVSTNASDGANWIISFRRANAKEVRLYEQYISQNNG